MYIYVNKKHDFVYSASVQYCDIVRQYMWLLFYVTYVSILNAKMLIDRKTGLYNNKLCIKICFLDDYNGADQISVR